MEILYAVRRVKNAIGEDAYNKYIKDHPISLGLNPHFGVSEYNPDLNRILINSSTLKGSMAHELFHAIKTQSGDTGYKLMDQFNEITGWKNGNPKDGPTDYAQGNIGADYYTVMSEDDAAETFAVSIGALEGQYPITSGRVSWMEQFLQEMNK